jgi:glycosyltransferase involved in cell wall biosynthesis
LRLLFIADRFFPLIGGGENYMFNLATKLRNKGHEVHVFTTTNSTSPQREIINGIEVFRFPPTLKILGQPIMGCISKILQEEVDVVHASGPSLSEDVFIPLLRIFKNPTVVTYHADFAMRNQLIDVYSVLKSAAILNLANRVIVTSEKYKEILLRRGLLKAKVTVVQLGVDEKAFKPAKEGEKASIKRRLKLSGDIILFVGGLSRKHSYKHPELLIEAFNSLRNRHEKINLLMVGGGERIEHYKAWSEKIGVGNDVIFTGSVSDSVLADLYRIADVFVLPSPSPSEGFGTVLLEAMSSACPVVCTTACGGSEVVRRANAGIVVRPWDVKGLELAIDKLLCDKQLAERLGWNGRRAVLSDYSLDKVVEKTQQVYEAAVRSANPRLNKVGSPLR